MSDNQNKDQKTGEGIVAPGRTVNVGQRSVGPGKKVTLPAEEVADLIKAGFLVDPDAPKIARDNGPTFGVKEGPSVKAVAA